jgi:hypothetical protein
MKAIVKTILADLLQRLNYCKILLIKLKIKIKIKIFIGCEKHENLVHKYSITL